MGVLNVCLLDARYLLGWPAPRPPLVLPWLHSISSAWVWICLLELGIEPPARRVEAPYDSRGKQLPPWQTGELNDKWQAIGIGQMSEPHLFDEPAKITDRRTSLPPSLSKWKTRSCGDREQMTNPLLWPLLKDVCWKPDKTMWAKSKRFNSI